MNYTKSDLEELTTREMHEIINSKFLKYMNETNYFDDLTKFANLGAWVINAMGGEIQEIEELIGKPPALEVQRELNDQDLELIEFCKENKVSYTITNTGIKMGA